MKKYPCKDCIIKLQCMNDCDEIKSADKFKLFFTNPKCPHCGCDSFILIDSYPIDFKCTDCTRNLMIYDIPYSEELPEKVIMLSKIEDTDTDKTEIVNGLYIRNLIKKEYLDIIKVQYREDIISEKYKNILDKL